MKRGSGVLLHISSLPSPYGVGDLGPQAYRFADFLFKSKQHYWQILPLTPTEKEYGYSPYSSPSAFAGNAILISPETLYQEGLLKKTDLACSSALTKGKADFNKAAAFKKRALTKAFERFNRKKSGRDAYERFCRENTAWLGDYVLFSLLHAKYHGKPWNRWPAGLRDRDPAVCQQIGRAFREKIEEGKFTQFIFYSQWGQLRKYCARRKINIMGDIPIYVNFDSVEVWKNPGLFKLDKRLNPKFVAGVPPDYFSSTGQRWGNPVYNWKALKDDGYRWWLARIGHSLRLYDYVRVDHFRGFVAYWQIPARAKTAVGGRWANAPRREMFNRVKAKFPKARIIAEDIGYITPAVRALIKDTGFPGMRVLQFAFGEIRYNNDYLPSNYPRNCVAYTGTHDNNTIKGWFNHEVSPQQRRMILKYIAGGIEAKDLHWRLIELILRSKAAIAIIPLQDILGLGRDAKMNTPSTASGNWRWRMPGAVPRAIARRLMDLTQKTART